MKTKIFILLFLLSLSISAQEFSARAIYKTSRAIKFQPNKNNPANEELQKQMQQRLLKMSQKTYILDFNRTESIYKQDVELGSPKPQAGNFTVMNFGGGSSHRTLYKNIKENRVTDKTDIMGKPFLIKDKLEKYNWVLTGETKNIGKYTCYKATFEKEVEKVEYSTFSFSRDPKHRKEKEKEKPKIEKVITTAWYTPEVPISNGPNNFGGLPGLILEINDGILTIVCTEIILKPSNKINIKEPTGGEEVSRTEYEKIQKKKSEEAMKRFNPRNGSGVFRIGG